MITPEQQNQIDYIMENFDFRKVHEYMTSVGWKWWNSKTDKMELPEEYELKQRARHYLNQTFIEKLQRNGSGGFNVIRFTGTDDEGDWERVSLMFVIEDWDNFD
jgi:hypothetical protein